MHDLCLAGDRQACPVLSRSSIWSQCTSDSVLAQGSARKQIGHRRAFRQSHSLRQHDDGWSVLHSTWHSMGCYFASRYMAFYILRLCFPSRSLCIHRHHRSHRIRRLQFQVWEEECRIDNDIEPSEQGLQVSDHSGADWRRLTMRKASIPRKSPWLIAIGPVHPSVSSTDR